MYCCGLANLASLAVGTHYGWTSPTLPKLESADSWLPVDDEESSWIGSIICLSSMFGPFLGGWLINKVGRRLSILISVVMSTIAWTVLIFSRSVWHIYTGRFIAGLAGGMVFLAVPTYVAEISEVLYLKLFYLNYFKQNFWTDISALIKE